MMQPIETQYARIIDLNYQHNQNFDDSLLSDEDAKIVKGTYHQYWNMP
jgi:hypothetical protein